MKVGVLPLRIISAVFRRTVQQDLRLTTLGGQIHVLFFLDVRHRDFVAAFLSVLCPSNLYAYNQNAVHVVHGDLTRETQV